MPAANNRDDYSDMLRSTLVTLVTTVPCWSGVPGFVHGGTVLRYWFGSSPTGSGGENVQYGCCAGTNVPCAGLPGKRQFGRYESGFWMFSAGSKLQCALSPGTGLPVNFRPPG